MTWKRFVGRNNLTGDYDKGPTGQGERVQTQNLISGDMRRLEADTLDDLHLKIYAECFGCSPEQARRGFRRFFGMEPIGDQSARHYYEADQFHHAIL